MAWNVRIPQAEFYDLSAPSHVLGALIEEVKAQPVVALDTETNGLTSWRCTPLFWSLAWGHRRVCMPATTMAYFEEAFEDPSKDWIFCNAKFDAHMLRNAGYTLAGRLVDTCVMHALLFEEKPHSLEFMGKEILGMTWKDLLEPWKKGLKRQYPDVGVYLEYVFANDPKRLIEYASNDAYGTLKIYEALKEQLRREQTYTLYPTLYPTMWDLFDKTEVPFTKVLWECETEGIQLDTDRLAATSASMSQALEQLDREIIRLVGRVLNPGSNPQMAAYFFGDLKLRPLGMTDGGKTGVRKPQLDDSFLEHYAPDVPVAKLLRERRELSKSKSTYADGLPELVDRHGRIHTKFNQDVARTGRLSSSGPNLQNIPNPESDKHHLREAFVPKPGHVLIAADYNALEMRLLAAAAGAQDMIDLFLAGRDIHMGNASLVYGVPYDDIAAAKKRAGAIEKREDEIRKAVASGLAAPGALPGLTEYEEKCLEYRRKIKIVGFGLNYGMKEGLLAANLGCTREEAGAVRRKYLDSLPAVERFYEQSIAVAREYGYADSILGRRRFLPEIVSSKATDRWEAERQAVNMEIQGAAADVARMAMLRCRRADLVSRYGCRMLLQVHDEIVFECPSEAADHAIEEIKLLMEHPFPTELAVPLLTSCKKSDRSWAHTK